MFNIKTFIFNPIRVNTYLLWDDTLEAAIIDCGAHSDSEKARLKAFIDENHLKPTLALNTHLHFDHTLGNEFLYKTYGLKPRYSLADESMPNLGSGGFFLPIKSVFIYTENYIADNEVVTFGKTSLKAIAVPGHSPGSLAFYNEAESSVFTGDALFHQSIGRTDLWKGDLDTLLHSIKTRLFTLPRETVVYPGHEETTTIGEEIAENPYF